MPSAIHEPPIEATERDEALLRRQAEHFNSIADKYHDARQGINHLLLKHLIWKSFFARAKSLRERPLDVLEPMCGYCDGLDLLNEHLGQDAVANYRGFDYSDRVIDTIKETRPDLDVWCADATKFSPEPESTDLVILLGGLHHVPNHAEKVVQSLAAGVRKGGSFISLEPTFGNPVSRIVREGIYRRNTLFDEQTERSFPVRDLFAMFKSAGFEHTQTMYPGLLAYILYYNPDAFPLLNVGGGRAVRLAWTMDRAFMRNFIGRALSFATLTLWHKP